MDIRKDHLQWSLFGLRISIVLVMTMWTIDKFVNPSHTIKNFDHFYFISDLNETAIYVIGLLEMMILVCFLLGLCKELSYATVALLHGVSTLFSFKQYLSPFEGPNLLFFAAWPMLAVCIILFVLRDYDIKFSVKRSLYKNIH